MMMVMMMIMTIFDGRKQKLAVNLRRNDDLLAWFWVAPVIEERLMHIIDQILGRQKSGNL